MIKFLNTKWKSFRRDDEGVTLVEYGIAVVLAIIVGTGGLLALSGQIDANLGEAEVAMQDRTP